MMLFIGGLTIAGLFATFALIRDRYRQTEAEYASVRARRFYRIEDAAEALLDELGREPTVAEIYDVTWPPEHALDGDDRAAGPEGEGPAGETEEGDRSVADARDEHEDVPPEIAAIREIRESLRQRMAVILDGQPTTET